MVRIFLREEGQSTKLRPTLDRTFKLRLITVRQSGSVQVYTFTEFEGKWKYDKEVVKSDTSAGVLLHNGSFIVDGKSGIPWGANRQRSRIIGQPAGEAHGCFITVGSKGVRCNIDVTGERVGKVDWPDYAKRIVNVQVIDKLGKLLMLPLP